MFIVYCFQENIYLPKVVWISIKLLNRKIEITNCIYYAIAFFCLIVKMINFSQPIIVTKIIYIYINFPDELINI